MFSAQPQDVGKYRTATEGHHKMANCSFKTFMCRKCHQPKGISGRKSLGWKAGFACRDCA